MSKSALRPLASPYVHSLQCHGLADQLGDAGPGPSRRRGTANAGR